MCGTSSYGEFLVIMVKRYDQTQVFRFSGYKVKKRIDISKLIKYSPPLIPNVDDADYIKFISENRNFDVCVADFDFNAVVVINKEGKFRFRYRGAPCLNRNAFCPVGIVTDSQSQILTVDHYNSCIHILDQGGCFLCLIDNCGLQFPCGICLDTKGNIYVAERNTGKVKKIQYCL